MSEFVAGIGEMVIGVEGDTLSALGLGSCVGLIIYDPESRIAGLMHIMLPDSKEMPGSEQQRTALLADHDESVKNILRVVLTHHNCAIVGESSRREELLMLYQTHKPTATFLNPQLPPADGRDILLTLKELDRHANIVVIGQHEPGVISKSFATGVADVIIPPLTEQKVSTSIEYVMNRQAYRFADKAVPMLKSRLLALGAKERNLTARVVGGACMFTSLLAKDTMNIGKRNVESVKAILAQMGIPIVGEQTGEQIGRTVIFDVATGATHIKTKNGLQPL